MTNKLIIKTPEEIKCSLEEISKQIKKRYNKEPLDLVLMNSAARYLVEDIKELLDMDTRYQNLIFESYKSPTKSGEVLITQDLKLPIFNRNIILVDGIIISGITHNYLISSLMQRLPKSISILSIGIKPYLLKYKLPKCFSLFEFNEEWVEGYGIGEGIYSSKNYLVDLNKS